MTSTPETMPREVVDGRSGEMSDSQSTELLSYVAATGST